MKYSDRILKTIELLENGNSLADIGCDHGYMCILAVRSGKTQKAYACDVVEGPLSKAKQNISNENLSSVITPVLSDGFEKVPSDIDRCVICGMGGLLIVRILQEGLKDHTGIQQMILGPHSEQYELRNYIINETPYSIYRETTLLDNGKYYSLLDIRLKSEMPLNEFNIYDSVFHRSFGNPMNQTDIITYCDYLKHECNKLEAALTKVNISTGERAYAKANIIKDTIQSLQKEISNLKEF